jgi:hypothetical protein
MDTLMKQVRRVIRNELAFELDGARSTEVCGLCLFTTLFLHNLSAG